MITEDMIREHAENARMTYVQAESALTEPSLGTLVNGAEWAHLAITGCLARLWKSAEDGLDHEGLSAYAALETAREAAFTSAGHGHRTAGAFATATHKAERAAARHFYDSTAPLTTPPPIAWDIDASEGFEARS